MTRETKHHLARVALRSARKAKSVPIKSAVIPPQRNGEANGSLGSALNGASADARTDTGARESPSRKRCVKSTVMKRTIVYFMLTVCVAGMVRADQTTQSVQQALKDQGFYYGNVTGDKGADTTAAIRRYQIRNGLKVTGEIDPETLRSLNVSSNSALSQPTSKPAVTQSNSVRADDTSRVSPNTAPSATNEPDRRLETNQAISGAPYLALPRRMNGRIIVAEVQRQLISRGYYRDRIDGRYGCRTAFAVGAFQVASGLPPTGHLDTSTLNALGLSDADLAYLQPPPRSYEIWVPITKFKHGKWKVKWKKSHHEDSDEYGDRDREENGNAWWHGEEHDD